MDNRHHKAKGRAALSNATGRFEAVAREAVDDGWDLAEELPPLRTEVTEEVPRSIITRNTSPDVPFDRSINPYRGCEHGCIYCFARPTHAYLGLSPGLDFETRLIARPDAATVLERELRRPSYRCATIAIGTNTDAYQPIEAERRIMRGILEVLQAFRHPVGIATKGVLVGRDIDILGDMAGDGLAAVGISVTTLDADLSRKMEPRVPTPLRRLRAVERLAAAGVPVRVMISPIVPGLSDHEIEAIVAAARDAGAAAATMIPLRLPLEVSELWQSWLAEHYPDRVERVMSKLRDMHGGKPYDAAWGKRMTGEGIWANLLQQRFKRAARAAGLDQKLPPLRTDLFEVPLAKGDQMALF
ncbi:PA0069 family radical SAM protein [Hasllibacter sp. MH4015]|uniref:PA0069 family radical SAM protein n=1 Tax=Hasllibacter sp. MH4015 TaxID=2854029 RepID=UPI001CD462EF|nr:PA0069 family radical SAM protein [Hasllibacter sp. MH4015]